MPFPQCAAKPAEAVSEVEPPGRPLPWTLFAGVIVTFTLYLGIAMIAAIITSDEKRREVCYRIFHDLVEFFREVLFRRRGRR